MAAQVAFYFDGQIRVSWSSVKAAAPFVGVSSGVARHEFWDGEGDGDGVG